MKKRAMKDNVHETLKGMFNTKPTDYIGIWKYELPEKMGH